MMAEERRRSKDRDLAGCKHRRRRGLRFAKRAREDPHQDPAGGGAASGMADAPHRAMIDLFLVLGTVAFFAISWAYVRFCDRLGGAP